MSCRGIHSQFGVYFPFIKEHILSSCSVGLSQSPNFSVMRVRANKGVSESDCMSVCVHQEQVRKHFALCGRWFVWRRIHEGVIRHTCDSVYRVLCSSEDLLSKYHTIGSLHWESPGLKAEF